MKTYLHHGFDAIAPSYLWHAQESLSGGHYTYSLMNKLRDKLHLMPLDKYKYAEIIKYLSTEMDYEENIYPSAIPQWDRSPRSGRQAVIYYGSTPELFKKHLLDIKKKIEKKNPEHKIVLLRSWNEWGEGNYFEPDLKYGTGYLDAVKDVFEQ